MKSVYKLFHLFFPHHHNNHKARTLHNSSLLTLIGLFLMGHSIIVLLSGIKPDILGYATQISPSDIISLTNVERSKSGAVPVVLNSQLSQAAAAKAADMFANNYWAHTSPKGVEPWFFVSQSGYKYQHAGENLARDFSSANSIVAAWMNSPTHKKNLLDTRYTDIGVAVVDGFINGVETTLVVQFFATPQSNSTTGQSINQLVAPAFASQPEEIKQEPQQAEAKHQAIFTPFLVSRSLSLAFIFFIIVALAIDWLFVLRYRIIRISGKSWAHLTYFLAMLIILLIIKQGLII